MKVLSVFGTSLSGKTTTIENIIIELRKRSYTVGSVKEIHFEQFTMDTTGSNTDRHKKAGSQLVTARGNFETDILFDRKLSVDEILRFYDFDYVIMEGVTDTNAPKIITAHSTREVDERLDDTVFAISGKLAETRQEYKGLPVINAVTQREMLVDLIEEKVLERLSDFPGGCCSACGNSYRDPGIKIPQGSTRRSARTVSGGSISLHSIIQRWKKAGFRRYRNQRKR